MVRVCSFTGRAFLISALSFSLAALMAALSPERMASCSALMAAANGFSSFRESAAAEEAPDDDKSDKNVLLGARAPAASRTPDSSA
jgi:hypothetical protein